jgi:hypothetical protein
MKRSTIIISTLVLALTLALSACAPSGTPTPSLAELQSTAMAQAQAQVAQTEAAKPTATEPPPPTDLPSPTPLPVLIVPTSQPVVVIPTSQPVITAASTKTTKKESCAGPLSDMKGPHVEITIVSKFKSGTADLYFYIYKTAFGCGYGSVNLEAGDSAKISIPEGCYDFYGWINGPKPSTPAGYSCFKKGTPKIVNVTSDGVNVVDN